MLFLLLLTGCSNLSNSVDAMGSPQSNPTITRPSPTSAPEEKIDGHAENPLMGNMAKVQQIISGMTLDEKLGQLIIVEYLGNSYTPNLQYMIAQQYVGGFLYQAINHNFYAPYNVICNVANFSRQAMKDARIPLLIGTDQEGGNVNRLSTFHGYLPSAAEMAATGDARVPYT